MNNIEKKKMKKVMMRGVGFEPTILTKVEFQDVVA